VQLYYDNDTVSGTLVITADEALTLRNMRCLVICDMMFKDAVALTWTDRITRLVCTMCERRPSTF
jgi:hypothetical protein